MLRLSITAHTEHAQELLQELYQASKLLLRSPCRGLAAPVGQFVEDTFPAMRKALRTWRPGALAK